VTLRLVRSAQPSHSFAPGGGVGVLNIRKSESRVVTVPTETRVMGSGDSVRVAFSVP